MTRQEISERYGVPEKMLDEYEGWGLCKAVKDGQYDDTDVERLSLIFTLYDTGFEAGEVETYMRLVLKGDGTQAQRILMLDKKRRGTLDEIHFMEKQLDRLDYLRYSLRK